MNRLKSYSRITVLTLCAFVVFAVQSLAETSQRFTLPATEAFIAKWSQSGGSELGSSQNFLLELCDLLEVPRPSSPRADLRDNTYTFEKQVSLTNPGGKTTSGRIDLYKRGAFIWESKQGLDKPTSGNKNPQRKGTAIRDSRAWDEAMVKAKVQAEAYARALPPEEGRPPFLLVADIGYQIDVYADFSGTGVYVPFPSARSNRLSINDLRRDDIRARLKNIWLNPLSLDPSRENEKVTAEIARKLADLAKSLEASAHAPEAVTPFLFRCIFTLFAEDAGLLPRDSFLGLLQSLRTHPEDFPAAASSFWTDVPKTWPSFTDVAPLPLTAEQLTILIEAAKAQWANVETSVFGALLQRALTPSERHQLGAFYTPTAYVERLVVPTVIEPLRYEWELVKESALEAVVRGENELAIDEIKKFHSVLSKTTILDPASGSGNFIATSLNLISDLEGEVVQALRDLGLTEQEIAVNAGIRPAQFRGVESLPLAASVSEVVLQIAYLQRHFKIYGNVPPPELSKDDFSTVECRDAILAWDGDTPQPATEWPQADFIVGNPPFVGNSKMRRALGDIYVEGLRKAYPDVAGTVDYALYWWHRAALLVREGKTRRFGFITSRTISQPRNRAVIEQHMQADPAISIVWAIADHPWNDPVSQAQVRIAMTVGSAGNENGVLVSVTKKSQSISSTKGRINPNLTIGVDVSMAKPLKANEGLATRGMQLTGTGFLVTRQQAAQLGLGAVPGLDKHIRPYLSGRDLVGVPRKLMVLDMCTLQESELHERFPAAHQYLLERLKPQRAGHSQENVRNNWWVFGQPREELRLQLEPLTRYIATPETARRRIFSFVDTKVLPDNSLIVVASDDAYFLGVLSSTIHQEWAAASGGYKGVGNDSVYAKTRCFDTFPFPAATEAKKNRIRSIAEQLDAHLKAQQAAFPTLTLTAMYGVLEKSRTGEPLSAKDLKMADETGLQELQRLHDGLDATVADAYGWPVEMSEQEVLSRLLELNRERAENDTGR